MRSLLTGEVGDTIFAPVHGNVSAAICIVRLSGPATDAALLALCGALTAPRVLSLRRLRDRSGETLDRALVVRMPAPHSYTGEPMAELHLHGGRAVIDGVSRALAAAGCRLARPGEFTRRAFLAGRMSLVEAEGMADLVAAETALQRRQAMALIDGQAGLALSGLRERLIAARAAQEALIDFPEDDLPAETEHGLRAEIAALAQAFADLAGASERAARLRHGLTFTIVGAPNVGKSSLLNALAARDVAIVSAEPGTTRDLVVAVLDLDGIPVTLIDTAGVRETASAVEREGITRAMQASATADLVLEVVDPRRPVRVGLGEVAAPVLLVYSMADVQPVAGELSVSARTGEGLPRLRRALAEHAAALAGRAEVPALSRTRHVVALSAGADALARAATTLHPELSAEGLRLAVRALEQIAGKVEDEDIIDAVFRQFCIGK